MTLSQDVIDVNMQRISAFLNETKLSLYCMESFTQFNLKPIYIIPNFINNGLKPMLSPNNQPCDKIPKKFCDFWKRTKDLDFLICLHTTKIHMLLEHDYPFPEYLSTPDPLSNKYNTIQCREALVQLCTLINKNFCSFIVKENHTFIKFFTTSTDNSEPNHPNHFCVIKLIVKNLEAKLSFNFFIYTPEHIREEFVRNLTIAIANLKFLPRGKQARPRHMSSQMSKKLVHVPPQQRSWEQINCCIILNLDLENLIAMYNPIKSVDSNRKVIRQNKMSLSMIYLHNQCHYDFAIWCINKTFVKNIFETLIKVRLQEGFHFAYSDSASGFINLIKEIKVLNNRNNVYNCFVQYMIYLDNNLCRHEGDTSTTPDDVYCGMADKFSSMCSTLKIITEIFIEKKNGTVTNSDPEVEHWNGLKYEDIPKKIIDIDQKCLETFVTYECFLIYPAPLPGDWVKPNICSVLSNSMRIQLKCSLFSDNGLENFKTLNAAFFDILDINLKFHEFKHIDITKTETANFHSLVTSYENCPYKDVKIIWHCYFTMKDDYLIVLMMPSNHLAFDFDQDIMKNLSIFVYGMSLRHLSFLIEDRWTLKLPEHREFQLPLAADWKTSNIGNRTEIDKTNEFAIEIDQIQSYLMESVKKLNSIYILTFVAGIHRNLRENRNCDVEDLNRVFQVYCTRLKCFDVDATKFMNTICSHCFNAVQPGFSQSNQALNSISNENCETRAGMHLRIVKRIRSMMAKYFKEVPSFPAMLIYCPETELESIAEFSDTFENDMTSLLNEDPVFINLQRQLSQDHQLTEPDLGSFTDNISDLDTKSISSIAMNNQNNCRPLFIMINYSLKYGNNDKKIDFNKITTCISDILTEMKSLTDENLNFEKLRFHLEMIASTVIDEEINNDIIMSKNENFSLIASGRMSFRKKPSDITRNYLSSFQTQLLTNCRNELRWTLDDEIVNCLKYVPRIDEETIELVMNHIDSTAQHKWHKSYLKQVQKKLVDLEFVFVFEKSKALFQERFENMTFGKYDQYTLKKIGNVYCVLQKVKLTDDPSTLGFSLLPDQTITDMDNVFAQSRMRYATMCLNRTTDDIIDSALRRWSSEGKLNSGNYSRKMSAEPQDQQNKPSIANAADSIKPMEFPQVANIATQCSPYEVTRQTRSPLSYPVHHQSISFTPRRHRSGEASSTVFTGNCLSDTPLLLNDLRSTATSSKGYEGDSSRVSDGEEYDTMDHFSNFVTDNKIDNLKSEIVPFWMLLNIVDTQKRIEVYFHHTDNCTFSSSKSDSLVCEYCSAFDLIFDKINECVHQVNQLLLLNHLAETRICRDILVPEESSGQKMSSMSHLKDYDYDDEFIELSKKFSSGTFSCPQVLKITFRLHSRLRLSTDKNNKAIPLLRNGLENIAVFNRKNMLIFVEDTTKGIFYAILREVTGNLDQDEIEKLDDNSFFVSYFNNQFSKSIKTEERIQLRNSQNLDILSVKSAPSFCESKSSNKPCNNSINQFRTHELLELSIHGIEKLSSTTISSIISNIGSKLDLIVLRTLSETICRTRAILLNKEDVDFLLSEGFTNKPQKPKSFLWALPKLVINNKLAFCYYLKQNLQYGFISPKICEKILSDRFSFNDENCGEVYLYNQTSAQGIPNEVIALFTLQLKSRSYNNSTCVIKYSDLPEFQLGDDAFFDDVINENHVREIDHESELNECYLNFNLWVRGVINVDIIKKKILNAIQYALNDLFMEYVVIPCPISCFDQGLLAEIHSESIQADKSMELDAKIVSFESGEKGNLNKMFSENIFKWIPELSKNDCPLLKFREFKMFSDLNVEFLLNDLVELINDSIHLNVFHLENNIWHPWNARLPKSGKEYPGIKRSFIVIGRIEELWRRYVAKRLIIPIEIGDSSLSNSQTSLSFNSNIFAASLNSSTSSQLSSNIKELRKVRLLLKQTPYDYNLLNASSTPSGTNVLNSSNMNNGLPEFCQVSNSVIVPRQMLCIIKVNGYQVDTITYNMAKELSEQLYNAIEIILKNHKSRSQMLNFFIYQKLGLFYETSCKSSLQPMSINTIKSLLQIPPVKGKSSSSIVELNRERKPSGPTRSFSPTASLVNKTMSNNQGKSFSKTHGNKSMTITINLSRLYQDVYTIAHLSEMKKPDSMNDIIYQHGIQFLTTYQLERQRRLLSKKIRQSISFLQPTIGFKQSELSENESPQQQLDVFSCLKRACRIFHSVVCPILFIPNVRKRLLDSFNKLPDKSDQHGEHSSDDDWIYEMSRLVLAYYADYVQKEHGFQFINPPRLNMSQNPGSHALFQKVSNNSGIHIIEVFILKGCLCVRLNLLEIRRINNNILNFTSSLSNFPSAYKSFVKDACKYCDLTHLVSFMYDVYVRMIAKSISYPDENKKNFNPISFIRDLVKMYSQPPLYATSHLYLMPFPVPTDRIKPDNLFEFLQRHCDDYNFSICSNHYSQENPDSNTSFLYNIEENVSPLEIMSSRKISPSSSSPLDVNATDSALSYKYVENNNEWDLTSIFCLTRSNQNSESCFDLFIITLNRSNCFPHQRLIPIGNISQKSSTFLATYLTILPHNSSSPADLLHLNPCPITLTHIDVNNMPESVAWRTYDNRSIIPLQVPLFLTLRTYIKKYFIESNEKFEKAITDCHKDFLWHRMYQRSENLDSIKFSLTFEEFQDLINSGDVIDILELDNRLMESMKIAASYLKELNDYMGVLSDDCYTVLYENTTSICHMTHGLVASHLVLMSKKTNDGFLLLSKNQESNSSSDAYHVQLKAIFRVQDCRNRVPLQRKYFSSSLKDITVMLAETAAFCIWRKLAMKPLNPGK